MCISKCELSNGTFYLLESNVFKQCDVCVSVYKDRAGEPALIFGGVPAAVPQAGCAGAGGAFWQAQRQVQYYFWWVFSFWLLQRLTWNILLFLLWMLGNLEPVSLYLFWLGWMMLRVDQDVNTHLNPNPSLTLEMTTIQMAVTQLQWPCHLHATQVRHSSRKKNTFHYRFLQTLR